MAGHSCGLRATGLFVTQPRCSRNLTDTSGAPYCLWHPRGEKVWPLQSPPIVRSQPMSPGSLLCPTATYSLFIHPTVTGLFPGHVHSHTVSDTVFLPPHLVPWGAHSFIHHAFGYSPRHTSDSFHLRRPEGGRAIMRAGGEVRHGGHGTSLVRGNGQHTRRKRGGGLGSPLRVRGGSRPGTEKVFNKCIQ